MICFHCGKHIERGHVSRDYHGNPVNLHRRCVEPFDADVITARATTNGDGRTYSDDAQHWSRADGVVRMVYARPGDREDA